MTQPKQEKPKAKPDARMKVAEQKKLQADLVDMKSTLAKIAATGGLCAGKHRKLALACLERVKGAATA